MGGEKLIINNYYLLQLYGYTDRLIIKPFHESEQELFINLLTNPSVGRPLVGNSPFLINNQLVSTFLDRVFLEFPGENNNWLLYSIYLKEDKIFIGGCGIKIRKNGTSGEMFYFLSPKYWGKGLTAEACSVLLKNIKKQKILKTIEMHIQPDNYRAQKVAHKLRFLFMQIKLREYYNKKIRVQHWILDLTTS